MFFSKTDHDEAVKKWLDEKPRAWLKTLLEECNITTTPRLNVDSEEDLVIVTINESDGQKARKLYASLEPRVLEHLKNKLSMYSKPPIPGVRGAQWTIRFALKWV